MILLWLLLFWGRNTLAFVPSGHLYWANIRFTSTCYCDENNVIAEQISPPSFISGGDDGSFASVIDQKWRCGLCSHDTLFEATETIRKFKFHGDFLALSLLNGHSAIVHMKTGDVLARFNFHNHEITALDFDGSIFVTGSSDGSIARHDFTLPLEGNNDKASPAVNTMRNPGQGPVFGVTDVFTRAVTGARLTKEGILATSMDRRLSCLHKDTGEILWSRELVDSPLCLDVTKDEEYFVVGFRDGTVVIGRPKDGSPVMSFRAHARQVRAVHFIDDSTLITGGGVDGVVRRWDISGRTATIPPPRTVLDAYFYDAILARANGLEGDKFDEDEDEFIHKLPPGSVRSYRGGLDDSVSAGPGMGMSTSASEMGSQASPRGASDTGRTSAANARIIGSAERESGPNHPARAPAVVAVQGDAEKIAAAYEDGRVVLWDVATRQPWFELRGRGVLISSVQYDDTRLLADGTSSTMIVHDFAVRSSDYGTQLDPYLAGSDGGYEITEESDDDFGFDEDGYPGSTG